MRCKGPKKKEGETKAPLKKAVFPTGTCSRYRNYIPAELDSARSAVALSLGRQVPQPAPISQPQATATANHGESQQRAATPDIRRPLEKRCCLGKAFV